MWLLGLVIPPDFILDAFMIHIFRIRTGDVFSSSILQILALVTMTTSHPLYIIIIISSWSLGINKKINISNDNG